MKFRIADQKDLDEIITVQKSAFKRLYEKYHDDETSPYTETITTITRRFETDDYAYYVLVDNFGVIVGYVGVQKMDSTHFRIGILGVEQSVQGKGYGAIILSNMKNLFRNDYYLELDTILEENRLVAFYENNGFQPFGELMTLQRGMTLVKMRYHSRD